MSETRRLFEPVERIAVAAALLVWPYPALILSTGLIERGVLPARFDPGPAILILALVSILFLPIRNSALKMTLCVLYAVIGSYVLITTGYEHSCRVTHACL